MKKVIIFIIVIIAMALYLTSLSNNSTLNSGGGFTTFYKKLPNNDFKFDLYDHKSSPIAPEAIKTLDGSYSDLIEFGKDSKYKIKISQIQHEEAMGQLKEFYINVNNMKICEASLEKELYKLCSKDPSKGQALYNYVKEQIYNNAKVPYKNAREYFYLNFKTILDEELRK